MAEYKTPVANALLVEIQRGFPDLDFDSYDAYSLGGIDMLLSQDAVPGQELAMARLRWEDTALYAGAWWLGYITADKVRDTGEITSWWFRLANFPNGYGHPGSGGPFATREEAAAELLSVCTAMLLVAGKTS